MRPDLLTVVTAIFNPIRWETRVAHYRRFRDHMVASGVKLVVVECAFGQRPHELGGDDAVTHIPVRANTLTWSKEALINIGITRGAPEADYIAWIDADIEFRRRDWAAETVHALQQYKVVQPWSEALDLGPRGEPMRIKGRHVQTSFAKVWRDRGRIDEWRRGQKTGLTHEAYAYPHPGYAWAARRSTLNDVGLLFEHSGLGAGDDIMAQAFIGNPDRGPHGGCTPAYLAHASAWCERATPAVGGDLGYVQGTIEHFFHGTKDKRQYTDRWKILIDHAFDPQRDVKLNSYGVPELAGNKPDLARAFDGYFRSRDEDANTLG